MSELNVCRFCGSPAVNIPPVLTPLFGGTRVAGFVGCSSKHHGRVGNTSSCYFYLMSWNEDYNNAVENWNKDNPYKSWTEWLFTRDNEIGGSANVTG